MKATNSDKSILACEKVIAEAKMAQENGIEFGEIMTGFIHFGTDTMPDTKEGYVYAAKKAKNLGEAASFYLSVKTWDTKTSKHLLKLHSVSFIVSMPSPGYNNHFMKSSLPFENTPVSDILSGASLRSLGYADGDIRMYHYAREPIHGS